MYHSNDTFGPIMFLFSFITISFSGFFQTLQLLGIVVGILSALMAGSWFLALHIQKINTQHNGSIRKYLRSFTTQKPKK